MWKWIETLLLVYMLLAAGPLLVYGIALLVERALDSIRREAHTR